MADELQRFLDDRPILARRVSTVDRIARWCRRNPRLAALSALLLLAIMAGKAASSGLAIRANDAAQRAGEETVRANRQKLIAHAPESKARNAENAIQAEAKRMRLLRYDSDMNVAAQLWESADGSPRAVADMLRAHRPSPAQEDLREFSWRYQWNLLYHGSVAE
jgi:hypothetical protein